MKKAALSSILIAVVLLVLGVIAEAAAEESLPDRVSIVARLSW